MLRHHCLPCCHHQRVQAFALPLPPLLPLQGEQGTGDDAAASLPALLLLLTRMSIRAAAAAAVAIAQASEGQVIMPRHHHPRYWLPLRDEPQEEL
jgi:hypothetical protein